MTKLYVLELIFLESQARWRDEKIIFFSTFVVSGHNIGHHLFLLRRFGNYSHSSVINQPTGLPPGDLLMILGARRQRNRSLALSHTHTRQRE